MRVEYELNDDEEVDVIMMTIKKTMIDVVRMRMIYAAIMMRVMVNMRILIKTVNGLLVTMLIMMKGMIKVMLVMIFIISIMCVIPGIFQPSYQVDPYL